MLTDPIDRPPTDWRELHFARAAERLNQAESLVRQAARLAADAWIQIPLQEWTGGASWLAARQLDWIADQLKALAAGEMETDGVNR